MVAIYTTTHEGQAAIRRSARHIEQIYHFAVWGKATELSFWTCVAYASRRDLAQARANELKGWKGVAIEPVACEIRLSKRQKDWLASGGKADAGKTNLY